MLAKPHIHEVYFPLGRGVKSTEILMYVNVPILPKGSYQSCYKITLSRTACEYRYGFSLKKGVCEEARIALGKVASAPYRAGAAEGFLIGKRLDEQNAEVAADVALSEARPLSQNAYKVRLTKALIKRAILKAL